MDKLKERRESLQKLRVEVLKRLESVEDDIKKTNDNINKFCEKSNNGHVMIREVEPGMYGETFYVCKHCGFPFG